MRSVRIPVLLVSLLLLSVVPLTEGNSAGKQSQSSGCSCHSQSGSTAATVSISGHPASYTPGSTYTLSISATGGVSGTDGGFSLEASHGSLSTGPTFSVNVNSAGTSATHSITGSNQRSWSVDWTAPSAGTGQATLSVAGLTADGSTNNNGDRWATATYPIPEAGAAPNSAPTASNLLLGPNGATTTSSLSLSYTYNDADNDPESGTTIDWFRDGVQVTNSGTTASPSLTAKHQEWYAVVTPSDGMDAGTSVTSNTLVIANTIPTVASPTVQPSSPETDDDLSYSASASDADQDILTYETRWLLEGSVISDLDNSQTVPSYATRNGENWSMEVRVDDGEATSAWQAAQTVQIGSVVQNTPPEVVTIDISPLTPTTTDALSVTYVYEDADNDAEVRHEIEWYRDGVLDTVYQGTGVPSTSTEKGQTWSASVRVSDGNAWSSWATTSTITIGNTAPEATSLEVSQTSLTTLESATITITQTDIDSDAMAAPNVVWLKDGVRISALDQSLNLPSEQTSKGEQWTVQVRANDGVDLSDNTLTASIAIINSAPSASLELNDDASSLNELNAIIGTTDADEDAVTYSVHWYRNGFLEASLANQTSVPVALLGPGQLWSAEVIAHDGETSSLPVLKTVTVLNIAPTSVITNPTPTIWIGELLTLDGSDSTDTDGRIVTFAWSWADTTGGSGTATGATATFTPTTITTVQLTVQDDSGDQASTTFSFTPVQGPTIQDLDWTLKGQLIDLTWAYDGPNASFSIERNGIALDSVTDLHYADTPLTSGDTVYTIRPIIEGVALQDGASSTVTVQVPATIDSTSSEGGLSASILGIVLLLIGVGSLSFLLLDRRD